MKRTWVFFGVLGLGVSAALTAGQVQNPPQGQSPPAGSQATPAQPTGEPQRTDAPVTGLPPQRSDTPVTGLPAQRPSFPILLQQRTAEIFQFFDRNNDRRISQAEAGGQLGPLFPAIDANNDGVIVGDELLRFQVGFLNQQQANPNAPVVAQRQAGINPGLGDELLNSRPLFMDVLFLALDTDRNGVLSRVEMQQAPLILVQLDLNGDGVVEPGEVLSAFLQVQAAEAAEAGDQPAAPPGQAVAPPPRQERQNPPPEQAGTARQPRQNPPANQAGTPQQQQPSRIRETGQRIR